MGLSRVGCQCGRTAVQSGLPAERLRRNKVKCSLPTLGILLEVIGAGPPCLQLTQEFGYGFMQG